MLCINGYSLAAYLIFIIPTPIYIFCKYKKIFRVLNKWWKILLSFGILFFLSRIVAEKNLNFLFEIEVQYLNYSATIYAFILAIILGSAIILFAYFISHCIAYLLYSFAAPFFSKCKDKAQCLETYFKFFIILGLFSPIAFLSPIADHLTHYYILADAYPVSDCGEKIESTWYIRKNKNQCYAIQFTSIFVPPDYKTISSPTQ